MKNRISFFIGPPQLTSERITQLIDEISGRYSSIEVKKYYGVEFNPEMFVNDLLENSLFVSAKILIVYQTEEIEKSVWEQVILPVLEKTTENTFVIFEGTSIKTKVQDYEVEYFEDVENLFRKIYKKTWQKQLTARDIFEISQFLKKNPYEFTGIIGMIGRHLENLLVQKLITEEEFLEKLQRLTDIDFGLKSGKLPNEPGWETLLLNLLDIRS
ncbi:MAG: hypothetical protein NC913_04525 [Candidatus Omnitrophica bacterium]|nr:hypothetical protein [Candidatus Omnitrophota bacterium]